MNHTIVLMLTGFLILTQGSCRTGQTQSDSTGIRRGVSPVITRPTAQKSTEPSDTALSTGVITLRDALAYAVMHNPDLKAFSFKVRAAEARALQAGLLPNPEIAVEIEEFGGAGERRGFESAETTIQLGQLIELGDKRGKRIHLASLDEERTRWDYESVRLDVMLEVTQAYTALLAAQERATLNEKVLDVVRKERSVVIQRVEAGKGPPVEELRASVALSRREIEAKKAATTLATARRKLAAAVGREAVDFEKATGDFYTATPVPSFDDVANTVAKSPDLERWASEERKWRAAVDLEKAKVTSDVTVAGGVRYFEEGDDTALVLGVALPIPLFNRNQGGVDEAMQKLAKTREQYRAAKIRRAAALAEALNRLAASYDEVTTLQSDMLANAQRAFEMAYQGYQEGKFDYLYVLDTQRTLFETKAQYIDALETYHKTRAQAERLMGRGIDAPNENQQQKQTGGPTQ